MRALTRGGHFVQILTINGPDIIAVFDGYEGSSSLGWHEIEKLFPQNNLLIPLDQIINALHRIRRTNPVFALKSTDEIIRRDSNLHTHIRYSRRLRSFIKIAKACPMESDITPEFLKKSRLKANKLYTRWVKRARRQERKEKLT
jgi:hypothetical protein